MSKKQNQLKLIDTPNYSYWQALFKSFYSTNLYVDVAKRWRGFGCLYLLFCIAIVFILPSIKFIYQLNKQIEDSIITPLLQLPRTFVQNGKIVFPYPMPYFIKNKKNEVVLIVDTTGKIKNFTSQYPNLNFLITQDNIFYKASKADFFSSAKTHDKAPLNYSFSHEGNGVFTGEQLILQAKVYTLKRIGMALIYPIMVCAIFGIFVTILLVLAFLGQIFAFIIFSYQISFKQSSKLLMIASTPAFFLLSLLITCDLIFGGVGIVLLIIVSVYFNIAIIRLKNENKKMMLK